MSPYSNFIKVHSDPRLREAIQVLSRAGFRAEVPSPWQLKVGVFNYFWSTGKITFDSGPRIDVTGIDAFVELLKEQRAKDGYARHPIAGPALPVRRSIRIEGTKLNNAPNLDEPPF